MTNTYVVKDNSEEHYCLICEEEMSPKHWFYYCATCDFSTHPPCVLENYPYIKFGKTYKDKNHQHHALLFERLNTPLHVMLVARLLMTWL